jgi:hypothetical protein
MNYPSDIGGFVIGESPIGVLPTAPRTGPDRKQNFDPTVDLTEALLWEYSQAAKLIALVNAKNAWYQTNHVQFWQNWVTNVFDIRTCGLFGLAVWSIILNIPLYVSVTPTGQGPAFGFSTLNKNFGWGNFQTNSASAVSLTIDQQRTLLLLRYNQLTGNCTVPFINRMLKNILGSYGKIYVEDPLDMSQLNYVVTFPPNSALLFIMTECNVLPRPAGVGLKITLLTTGQVIEVN